MKISGFILLTLFYSVCSFAQNKEVSIICSVDARGNIVYPKSLEKILPDSLKASILINIKKDYQINKAEDALLYMGANGWRICFYNSQTNYIIMNREILLDEAAWQLYIRKLQGTGSKGQK